MAFPFDGEHISVRFQLVEDLAGIEALSPAIYAVLARRPSDKILAALADRVPRLRVLMTDGNARYVTDRGVQHLLRLQHLHTLDLEYSAISDSGLLALASLQSLRWLDIGGAPDVTAEGIAKLRALRPTLEIVWNE